MYQGGEVGHTKGLGHTKGVGYINGVGQGILKEYGILER